MEIGFKEIKKDNGVSLVCFVTFKYPIIKNSMIHIS